MWLRHLIKQKQACTSTSVGLLFWPSLRRIVGAAGYRIRPAIFAKQSTIAVWGRGKRSRRAIANSPLANVVTFEDAFLRSVVSGPKTPPIGITIDDLGVYFDSSNPSRLETILQSHEFDAKLLARAKDGREFLRNYGLSKYNLVPRGHGGVPTNGYVLVVDQVVGDASVAGGQANADTFSEMLAVARAENPQKKLLIRAHPATFQGKIGYFSDLEDSGDLTVLKAPANPWDLLEGADKVYCVSSQLGFEAILAGHKPVVFGLPFYAGWGLSEDQQTIPRRTRKLTVDQLFAGAMIEFPFWFDRTVQAECSFEDAARQLLAEARHYWDGLRPSNLLGMRLWKRPTVRKFLQGAGKSARFFRDEKAVINAASDGKQIVVWASRRTETLARESAHIGAPLLQMEDGFLRSTGLGAELTPASSLVLDDTGIYYDPTRPSQLETLIKQSVDLPVSSLARASKLRQQIVTTGVTKYNIAANAPLPEFPENTKIILVPGQVADDASILKGGGKLRTNMELLQAVREANPMAYIIYKPHPDVLIGLRDGTISSYENCDFVADNHDANMLIACCDEVWTITSLLGFEALLRDKKVICLGTPFYAGWGLTRDLDALCARRDTDIDLDGLVHAALIDYPRYMDPVSGLACTPELIVKRLANGETRRKPALRILAKLQGWFSGYASIWR